MVKKTWTTNMAAPRTESEIELDLLRVSELYLQGHNMTQIAQKLDRNYKTILADMETLRKRWREKSEINIDEVINMELQRIAAVEMSAWEAFEKSKIKTVITMDGPTPIPNEGNPRFLELVLKCCEQRCTLLGIAKRIDITSGGKELGSVLVLPDNNRSNRDKIEDDDAADFLEIQ